MTEATKEDWLMDRAVRVIQPARGYRAGLDAALLAAAVPALPGQRVIEAGCGSGAVLAQVAGRRPGVALTGIEREAEAAERARATATLNGEDGRTTVIEGDVAKGFKALGLEPFDWAISNPPFFDDAGTMRAPAEGKRAAWMADDGLAAWTGFLLKAVREGGSIVIIHRAERLADLLALLAPKAGSFQIKPLHPHAGDPAKRVLVKAVKTGKAPLKLLPPLVLHDAEGGHSAEAEAILRGRAGIEWAARDLKTA